MSEKKYNNHDIALHIKHLSAYLTDTKRYLLHNINFEVNVGDFIILLGHNGSGKSSLISCLNQTSSLKYKGSILLNGKKSNKGNINLLIATVTQNINSNLFLSMTILENFLIYSSTLGKKLDDESKFDYSHCQNHDNQHHANYNYKTDQQSNKNNTSNLIENFKKHLSKFNRKLINLFHQSVQSLSGGERQALALALAMYFPRKILLLDEHTSALDPKSSSDIMKITNQQVKELGLTCIMTTHDLDYAIEYGNRIIALKDGMIFKNFNKNEIKPLKKDDLLEIFSH